MTPERRKEIEGRAINTYGEQPQVNMAIEEMPELTKELLKLRRESTQAGFQKRRESIKEEIADVQIMLDQMRLIFGDTAEQEEFKLKRLNDRLKSRLKFYEFKSRPYPYYALICSQTPKTATEVYETEICTLDKEEKELSPVELTKKQVKAKLYSCFDFEQIEELLGKPEEGILLLDSALE